MARTVKIQFQTAGKLYDFSAGNLELQPGDKVIVETERGRSMGTVITEPVDQQPAEEQQELKGILRKATQEDSEIAARNSVKEKEAFDFCLSRVKERGMDMKLVTVEYLFDGSKAIFYFTADGRVDFRELVKDLAHQFHTRIEMRQIGVRDESKMVGGIGICGRELCCCTFLREFQPVSVKMAKEQSLALNPTKISGQCGRLLCCLEYEYDTYCNLKKGLPKCGKRVHCGSVEGEVVKVDILEGAVVVKTDDEQEVVLKGEDIRPEHIVDKPKRTGKEQKEAVEQKQRPNREPRGKVTGEAKDAGESAKPDQGKETRSDEERRHRRDRRKKGPRGPEKKDSEKKETP